MEKETIQRGTDTLTGGDIILYQAADGSISIDVKFENNTVWLTQEQLVVLFERDKSVISRHIRNIFNEGELNRDVVVAKYATTSQHGALPGRSQTHEVLYYSLDVIISVGYRVKSRRGTQFRIWANGILRDYLIKGYAVRTDLIQQKYDDLKSLVEVMGRTMGYMEADSPEQMKGVADVVRDYAYALDTLDGYDYRTLGTGSTSTERFHATYDSAMDVIRELKEKFGGSDLFGHQKDGSFHSSIGQIYQTWDGVDLYPSAEEKAAVLLYLVVKNHSFSDGNKRIAAALSSGSWTTTESSMPQADTRGSRTTPSWRSR